MLRRRSFLKRAGWTLAAASGAGQVATTIPASRAAGVASTDRPPDGFVLGMAGYTFNKFAFQPTLEMLRQVDVHYLCIKDFHLPLASTDEEVAKFHATCGDFGVQGYGVGPIYMGSPEEVDRAFAYARRVGVATLVGVPFDRVGEKRVASARLLKVIEQRVREYDIRYAIHNHGPDMPELFPNAESVMEMIGDLDSRVGLCLDIGHQFRDGKDPVRAVRQFAERIHDIHLKNVTAPTKQGRAIELPRGEIDLVAFVRALRQINYRGACGLEYEKDMSHPLTGIAECVGYFRGLLDATR